MKRTTILFLGLAASLMIAGCGTTSGNSSASASSETPTSSDSSSSSSEETSTPSSEESSEPSSTPSSEESSESSTPSSDPSSESSTPSSEPSSEPSAPSSEPSSESSTPSSEPSSSSSSSSEGPSLANPVLTGIDGATQTSYIAPYTYTYNATLGESSTLYGTTDLQTSMDLSGINLSYSQSGIISVTLSQSVDDWDYYRVEFAITGAAVGETTLTITDSADNSFIITVTVSEASEGGWADVLSAWNSTNLVNYYNATTAPVEPTFTYTSASFTFEESPWMTGSYTLTIVAAVDYWDTYVQALAAADAEYDNYTWNFGAYDSETNSYPLTVIESLSGSCTYDTTAGAIVISFAAIA